MKEFEIIKETLLEEFDHAYCSQCNQELCSLCEDAPNQWQLSEEKAVWLAYDILNKIKVVKDGQ